MLLSHRENPVKKPVFNFGADYTLRFDPPSVEDYLHFRKITGLGDKNPDAVAKSLAESVLSLQVLHKGQCIAFFRLLSDGGHWFYMADGVVLPAYQASGLGKYMVSFVTHAFYETAPPGAYLYAVTHAPEFGVKCGLSRTPADIEGFYSWIPMDLADIGKVKPKVAPVELFNRDQYNISADLPSEEEFHLLRKKMGLHAKDKASTFSSFHKTKFAITIRIQEKLVGFSRILGDGGVWYYFGDVLLDPDYSDTLLDTYMLYRLNEAFYSSDQPGAYLLLYTKRPQQALNAGYIKLPEREVPLYCEQYQPTGMEK